MDAEIKKTIDGRTKEFKEKLAKLAYEKTKQILSPEAEPLKGKGYPYQDKVQESIEEESDSKEFQQEIDMIANMIKKGEHERLAKMLKRDQAFKKGGGWNMAQKPSKKQKDQYNKMIGDHKKKYRSLYQSYAEDVNEQEMTTSLDEANVGYWFNTMPEANDFYKKAGRIVDANPPTVVKLGNSKVYTVELNGEKRDLLSVAKLAVDSIKESKIMEDVNEQEITFSLDESVLVERLRLRNPNKLATIDIDYIRSSSDINQSQREYNIKIKKTGRQMADVTGKKGDIVKFLQGDAYAMDDEDIEELFPELLEGVREVENMFGFRAGDWRKLVKKHARHIDAFQKGRKDLPKKVEDELLTWALDNGEVSNDDEDMEDFIDIILNASFTPTRNDIIAEETFLNELKARYDLSDMRSSNDPKVKREFKKLEKVQYGSLQYIRQYKEVEKALDDSLPAHKRKK